MNKIRSTIAAVGIAALMVIALACGIGAEPAIKGSIAADLRLTYEGVEHTAAEILGAATPNGSRVSGGTPIDMDDMELVGTGAWHQPDGDKTVQIYRPKDVGTTDVYTFHPSQTLAEVGGTTPATWTRWAAE